jgi:hypothetical protein
MVGERLMRISGKCFRNCVCPNIRSGELDYDNDKVG